jgi:hypothetical protein
MQFWAGHFRHPFEGHGYPEIVVPADPPACWQYTPQPGTAAVVACAVDCGLDDVAGPADAAAEELIAAAGADVDPLVLPHAASRNAHAITSTIRPATTPLTWRYCPETEFSPALSAAALYAGPAKAGARLSPQVLFTPSKAIAQARRPERPADRWAETGPRTVAYSWFDQIPRPSGTRLSIEAKFAL